MPAVTAINTTESNVQEIANKVIVTFGFLWFSAVICLVVGVILSDYYEKYLDRKKETSQQPPDIEDNRKEKAS